ncbi:unnamed protein product [Trichogramma brassicae]|uniref:Uncharacterized protein n=1 Tax=Trichogramma brassicae TaxID=86971 RepID=A0A6H5IIF5_9HYME|nr:unnamed protein product [Trichogramma brassicae]
MEYVLHRIAANNRTNGQALGISERYIDEMYFMCNITRVQSFYKMMRGIDAFCGRYCWMYLVVVGGRDRADRGEIFEEARSTRLLLDHDDTRRRHENQRHRVSGYAKLFGYQKTKWKVLVQRTRPGNHVLGRFSSLQHDDRLPSSRGLPTRKFLRLGSVERVAGSHGVRKKVVFCVRLRSTQHVPNTKCDPARKPLVKILVCNSVPCRPRWELGPWSECSVSCGNGTRSRQPICRQVISDTVSITVNDSLCPPAAKADLVAPTEICLMTDCSKYSTTTAASIISVVEPLVLQSSSNIVTTRRFVSKTTTAAAAAAERSRWKVGDWSQCSKSCGSGSVRTRPVTCITAASSSSSSGAGDCDPAERPASEENCRVEACDKETPSGNELPSAGVAGSASSASGSWLYSDWPEQCSAACGAGIVHRRLYCESSSTELCDESKMPEFNKTCYGSSSECGGQWFVGPWTKCSQSCGAGVQRREVKCIVPDGTPTNETQFECDANKRPIGERSCNATACSSNPIASINETKKNSTDTVNEKQPIAGTFCFKLLLDRLIFEHSPTRILRFFLIRQQSVRVPRHTDSLRPNHGYEEFGKALQAAGLPHGMLPDLSPEAAHASNQTGESQERLC